MQRTASGSAAGRADMIPDREPKKSVARPGAGHSRGWQSNKACVDVAPCEQNQIRRDSDRTGTLWLTGC